MSINDLQNFEELPVGWSQISLKEVLPISYGKGLPKAKRDESGPYPVYGSSGQLGNHSEAITKKGSLIIGRKGSVGEVYYSKNPCWPIDTVYFVEKAENISLRYFLYLLKGLNLGRLDRSTAIPGLSRDDYNSIEVAIAPANEQKRIVAEIEKQFSRLDEAVENLQRVKANLKRYKASVLKDAVEGKLTEHWRAEHPDVEPASKLLDRILTERRKKWEEAELAKMKAKGKLPKDEKWKKKYKDPKHPKAIIDLKLTTGWVWTNLDQLKIFSLYGPRFSSDDYAETGCHVLRTSDISNSGKVDISNTPKLKLDNDQFEKYHVEKGDLLITRTGSLGTLAVYSDEVEAIPGAYLIQYRLVYPLPICWYLFFFFKSPIGKKYIIVGGAGVGRPNLNVPTLEDIPIPLPPKKEQEVIIKIVEEKLSITEHIEFIVETRILQAESLRKSILQKAFSGKLVSQNPNDEPAQELINRVRQEKFANEEGMKVKRRKKVAKKRKLKQIPIIDVLKETNKPISTADLVEKSGYPKNANPETIEFFYLDLKNVIEKNRVEVHRKGEFDYFRLKRIK